MTGNEIRDNSKRDICASRRCDARFFAEEATRENLREIVSMERIMINIQRLECWGELPAEVGRRRFITVAARRSSGA